MIKVDKVIQKVTETSTSDLNPDSDYKNPAMDPNSHVEYARLRLETSNIMMKLKREYKISLEDPGVPLEDKINHVKEKVGNALLLVSSIPGQLTSSLSLSKTLVTQGH